MKNIIIISCLIFSTPVFSQICNPWYPSFWEMPMIGFWSFDQNGLDESPNQTNGVLHNVEFGVNRCGEDSNAIKLTGNNSYVDIPNSFHSTGNFNVTYSMWLKPFTNTKNQTILHVGSDDTNQVKVMMWEGGNLGIKLKGLDYHSEYQLPVNEWNHLTITKDDSMIRFWVNRIKVDSLTFNIPQNLTNTNIRIGADNDTSNNYIGMIDLVTMFNYSYDWMWIWHFWWGGPVSNQKSITNKINIYPNPTSDFITIEGNGDIMITNSIGVMVYNSNVSNKETIDVSNWNKGIYFIRFNKETTKIQIR